MLRNIKILFFVLVFAVLTNAQTYINADGTLRTSWRIGNYLLRDSTNSFVLRNALTDASRASLYVDTLYANTMTGTILSTVGWTNLVPAVQDSIQQVRLWKNNVFTGATNTFNSLTSTHLTASSDFTSAGSITIQNGQNIIPSINTSTVGTSTNVFGSVYSNNYYLGTANINTAGTLSNIAYLNQNNSFTGSNTFGGVSGTTFTTSLQSTFNGTSSFTGQLSVNGAYNPTYSTYGLQVHNDVLIDSGLVVTGNVNAGSFTGNGSGITNIPFTSVNNLGSMAKADSVTFHGNPNITTLGTIASGIWQGTAIVDAYISSSTNWNDAYSKRVSIWNLPLTFLSNAVTFNYSTTNFSLSGNNLISNQINASANNLGFSVAAVNLGGTQSITVPQDLQTTASPTFNALTLTTDLTLQNNYGLLWAANTDWGRIRFESTGDGAGLSNVVFRTGDNGDEGWKFIANNAGVDNEILYLYNGQLRYLTNKFTIDASGNVVGAGTGTFNLVNSTTGYQVAGVTLSDASRNLTTGTINSGAITSTSTLTTLTSPLSNDAGATTLILRGAVAANQTANILNFNIWRDGIDYNVARIEMVVDQFYVDGGLLNFYTRAHGGILTKAMTLGVDQAATFAGTGTFTGKLSANNAALTEAFNVNGNTKQYGDIYSDNWNNVDPYTGYYIGKTGSIFSKITANELHVKSFIADLEQALAGGQVISKSVAKLYADVTTPAALSTSFTFTVESFDGFPNVNVFAQNDYVRLRSSFNRTNNSLSVTDSWAQITSLNPTFADNGRNQTWTATLVSGQTSASVKAGSIVNDYGQSGNGIIESIAINPAGNSPYSQIATWTTTPYTDMTVQDRRGDLTGITANTYGALSGLGTYSQNAYFEKNVNIAGTLTAGDANGFGNTFYAGKIAKNLVPYSNTLDNTSFWVYHINNTVSQNVISPDGQTNGWTITFTAAGELSNQFITVSPSTTYIYSFYAKRGTATEDYFYVYDNTHSSYITQTNIYNSISSTSWTRYVYKFTTPAGCTSLQISISRIINVGAIGTTLRYGVQLEQGSFPTNYQPTDGTLSTSTNYGMWSIAGGFGGTIQNPVVSLNDAGLYVKAAGHTANVLGNGSYIGNWTSTTGFYGTILNENGLYGYQNNVQVMKVDNTGALLGGWTINSTTLANGTNIILDASNKIISINNSTFGSSGVQLDYNSGTPRAYIGDGASKYFNFDGTNISWAGTNTSLTTAGLFTATNATITGTINANAGNFSGNITSTAIITGGTIQGDSLRTAVYGGQRILIDKSNKIKFYNSSNSLTSIYAYDTNPNELYISGGLNTSYFASTTNSTIIGIDSSIIHYTYGFAPNKERVFRIYKTYNNEFKIGWSSQDFSVGTGLSSEMDVGLYSVYNVGNSILKTNNIFDAAVYLLSGTTVIDGARNLTNIRTISSGAITSTGNLQLNTSGLSVRYIITDETNTGTQKLIIQAGGGSATYGGAINLFANANATYPGWVIAGISSGSGGKFAVNSSGLAGGINVATIDASGNATFSGTGTFTSYVKATNLTDNIYNDNTVYSTTSTTYVNQFTKVFVYHSGNHYARLNANIWSSNSSFSTTARITVNGVSNTITTFATTGDPKTCTVDISGLTDGTKYTVAVGLETSGATANMQYTVLSIESN